MQLTIKNYRCFPIDKPVTLDLRDGFTALLGVNNAGKSSLLRFFFEFRDLFRRLTIPDEVIYALRGEAPRGFNYPRQVEDSVSLFHVHNDQPIRLTLSLGVNAEHAKRIEIEVPRNSASWKLSVVSPRGDVLAPHDSYGLHEGTLMQGSNPVVKLGPYLSMCDALSRTFYIGSFRNILNTGAKDDYYDIQVGQSFVQRWRQMQAGKNTNENRIIAKVVESIEALFGYRRLEVQAAADDQTLQVTINGHPYKLHELGSGIAQFILVLANVAVTRPSFIMIDEPELSLHPSLQVDFLTSLASYAKSGTLFATHSIGLARAVAERIYSIRAIADGISQVSAYEATPDLAEFLGSLGFSSYQALGFNKVLLVEGVTEVQTIQQFLRRLGKDHKILLLPLGGGAVDFRSILGRAGRNQKDHA